MSLRDSVKFCVVSIATYMLGVGAAAAENTDPDDPRIWQKAPVIIVEAIYCLDTQDSGEDEIYLRIKSNPSSTSMGTRFPETGSQSMNENDKVKSIWRLNKSWNFETDIVIELWEDDGCNDDKCADDEKIGKILLDDGGIASETRMISRRTELNGEDGGKYVVWWKIAGDTPKVTTGDLNTIDKVSSEPYSLPLQKTPRNVVGVATTFVDGRELYYTWFTDGTFIQSNDKYNNDFHYQGMSHTAALATVLADPTLSKARYKLPEGRAYKEIMGMAIEKDNATRKGVKPVTVHTWYNNCEYHEVLDGDSGRVDSSQSYYTCQHSIGTPEDLGSISSSGVARLPNGAVPRWVVGMSMESNQMVTTWYTNGRITLGWPNALAFAPYQIIGIDTTTDEGEEIFIDTNKEINELLEEINDLKKQINNLGENEGKEKNKELAEKEKELARMRYSFRPAPWGPDQKDAYGALEIVSERRAERYAEPEWVYYDSTKENTECIVGIAYSTTEEKYLYYFNNPEKNTGNSGCPDPE